MKLGILRETKNPPDRRVPFNPQQCKELLNRYPEISLFVQPSEYRCFTDEEYLREGIELQEDLTDCDILLGVKEVKIPALIEDKTYFFFSHTAKEQAYNRSLLQEILKKRITILDYEYLTREDKSRVVAFGRWAGIVGAYNGLKAYGTRYGLYELKPANELHGLEEMKKVIAKLNLNGAKIVLTGGGRVASGAIEILKAADIKEVDPQTFLNNTSEETQFCRLDPWHYTKRKDGTEFDFGHFIEHPDAYENAFIPYAKAANFYIACHFWDPESPKLLELIDMQAEDFPIKVIADISCDINGPIASTVRASSIADPVYGFDPKTGKDSADAFNESNITVMAVDNLPGELPRDASTSFGEAMIQNVIPSLLEGDKQGIIERAMIAKDGSLCENYSYLEEYVKNNDKKGKQK